MTIISGPAAFVRSLPDLQIAMKSKGFALDDWRDPSGQHLVFDFSIAQTRFVVDALTKGTPDYRPRYAWDHGSFSVGSVSIDYTEAMQTKVQTALSAYAMSHPFPQDSATLSAALRASSLSLAQLTDPWHRPLFATFRTHSFYTDRMTAEAHATPGTTPVVRTIVTPVTAISDSIDLHSHGPNGSRDASDDFVMASFSRTRSTQSAQEKTPKQAQTKRIYKGPSGDIAGIVIDPSGATIPGVTVAVTNIQTGDILESKTDQDGRYLIGPLPVGTYKIKMSMPGFADLIYSDVHVVSQITTTLDAKLNIGSVNETVDVTVSAQVLETSSASVALVRMSPGVLAAPTKLPKEVPASTPRLRDYFPETLLWRPEIITAADGTAKVNFRVADNITNWQLSAAASTLEGNTGSGTAQFQTFQPFFAAFDPPSILTVGDTISLPVTLRNYLDHPLSVTSSLAPADWFRVAGAPKQNTQVRSQESASPVFRFTTTSPVIAAQQEFVATANEASDRIARPVTVHPHGQEQATTSAGILSPGANTLTITLPVDTLHDGTDATLKLYPNLGAHLRDALVAMADYPDGCAEQITSIAWPSLLLQRYAASLPERDVKLDQQTRLHLQQAYENLLANQLGNGGFAYWHGNTDADEALTAYAIQFLHEASAFVTIDDAVIKKAISYLNHQQKNGLWIRTDRSRKVHPEDRNANAMLTASIAAMLAGVPDSEPMLRKALPALQPMAEEFDEPYTLASYALAAMALKDTARSEAAIKRLRAMTLQEGSGSYWQMETNTPFFGWGRAGRVESTAMVLRALLAAGATPQDNLIARGLLFLDHEQDRHSLWYSTQATARVLDVLAAIALRAPTGAASAQPGVLTVSVDGGAATHVPLPPSNTDAGPFYVPLGSMLRAGEHAVKLDLPLSASSATAQLVASFYRPWTAASAQPKVSNNEQLRLSVGFSATNPSPGQPVTVTARVERLGFRGYGMLIAEVGLPPGADVDRASLETAMTQSGYEINHYEVLPDKVLFYLWPKAGGLTLHFRFSLRYGIDAFSAPSSAYDYYNPDLSSDVAPQRFTTR